MFNFSHEMLLSTYDEKMAEEATDHLMYKRLAVRAERIRNVFSGGSLALGAALGADKLIINFLHGPADTLTTAGLGAACLGLVASQSTKLEAERADGELLDSVFEESEKHNIIPPSWVFDMNSYVASAPSDRRNETASALI